MQGPASGGQRDCELRSLEAGGRSAAARPALLGLLVWLC